MYTSKTTQKDLIKILDQKYNTCMGWRSTVYTQKDLEILAHNLDTQLNLRLEETEETEVSKYDFNLILDVVQNIYEGFYDHQTVADK